MENLFCFICYVYTLLTFIVTTNTNTIRVNVISSTCTMYKEDSDCSKYDLQICHGTRTFCPRKNTFHPNGCFGYVNYTDLRADKGSMQHFQPPNEKIQDMTRFVIAVVNRGLNGPSSGVVITASCESNRIDTTNGINITTTNAQNGQPYGENGQTFNFALNIEMDCAISSCYGQECEICVTTEKTTAYTFADTLQTNITVIDDQTTHYTQNVETGNSVSTQQVKTSNLTTQRVKTNSILTTQGEKTTNILTTQRVNTGNEVSTPLTTSTEHTENSMTTVRPNGNLTEEGSPQIETNLNTGQIIGIVFGVCGGIILVMIALYIICNHKKTRITADEDVPEIHIENDGVVETHEQFERVGEQQYPETGVSNLEQQTEMTHLEQQNPENEVSNLEQQTEVTNLEQQNPETGVSNLEQQTEMTNLERQNTETGVSNLEQHTEVTNLEQQNSEADRSTLERQIVEAEVSNLEQQNPETEMTNLEQQNPETGVSRLEQQTEVTNLERQNPETGVSNLEQQTEVTNLEQQNAETGVSNLEQQTEMTNLERQNAETGVSNLEQQTEVTNLEQQNPETGVSRLEQQTEVTSLEQQNQETIVLNLEQQNFGTEQSSLERQNVEAGLSNSATASQLSHRSTTKESDHGDKIKSKKKKKHKYKRRINIDIVEETTNYDDLDGYEAHVDVKVITSPKKKKKKKYDKI